MNVTDSRPAEPLAPSSLPPPSGCDGDLSPYDYQLPPELIAQEPLPERDASRLMLLDRAAQRIEHGRVLDFASLLSPGDLVVFNNTRVSPARLLGQRVKTRGAWEGLFLQARDDGSWRILARTRGKIAAGEEIVLASPDGSRKLSLTLVERLPADGSWIVRPESNAPWPDLLDGVGYVPLPPYIRHGRMKDEDKQRYQTVYASQPGAVAAPTAGLHFSPRLLDSLTDRGVQRAEVTLHVGLGTFRPITADRLEEHAMHSEWGQVPAETAELIRRTRAAGGRIVAIGTTVVRVLESAAAACAGDPEGLQPWQGWTDLFIRPGFTFRAIDALFTNFHFPRSTLLVLAQTFGGRELVQQAYRTAIEAKYRFYSYGDAMLIR